MKPVTVMKVVNEVALLRSAAPLTAGSFLFILSRFSKPGFVPEILGIEILHED